MRILLMSMPDTISVLDPILRIPNLGLCSVAGNLEGCQVAVADLSFRNRGLGRRIERLLADTRPDLVGLSAMSFQYESARRAAALCRRLRPDLPIVLGGYHATLMHEEVGAGPDAALFDFLVRGEGEATFARLVRALSGGREGVGRIPGLSFRRDGVFRHAPAAPLADLGTLKLPDRDHRLFDDARFLRLRFDCVETSRGCTMGCRFCSISRMYGRAIRLFPLERVIEDLHRLKARGVEGVFFVDDNITLDVPRLKELCRRIIAEGLDGLSYLMQASVRGIAADPGLPELLGRAGFRWVFLGIESGDADSLSALGKTGVLQNTRRAVSGLQEQGICIFGGFIIGHPNDDRTRIAQAYRYALELGVDHPIMQCLTPYPKTGTRDDLLAEGLVENAEDYSHYNGFIANVRTRRLSTRQLTRSMLWGGLRLYFHPRYLLRSRFWRFHPLLWPALAANNLRYLLGALRGRMFASRHTW